MDYGEHDADIDTSSYNGRLGSVWLVWQLLLLLLLSLLLSLSLSLSIMMIININNLFIKFIYAVPRAATFLPLSKQHGLLILTLMLRRAAMQLEIVQLHGNFRLIHDTSSQLSQLPWVPSQVPEPVQFLQFLSFPLEQEAQKANNLDV